MYAVLESGGKQYKVKKGDIIYVEKLSAEKGSSVEFKVLALAEDGSFKAGSPYIDTARVLGNVLETKRGKKITVFTYKPKKSCKRKMGHRQWQTKVEISEIIADVSSYA
jgi:ribosomal protein L21